MPGSLWEAVVEDLPGAGDVALGAQALVRLTLAALLGGMLGVERGRSGRPAGMRTHMLVSLGAAFFVLAPVQAGMNSADLSRVIQGLVTGIGFLGAGSILKLQDKEQVRGLTTAAEVWVTTGIGVAAGLGRLGLAVFGAALTLAIVTLVKRFEKAVIDDHPAGGRHRTET